MFLVFFLFITILEFNTRKIQNPTKMCPHFDDNGLCETSYSKMKYAKNVYRNWLTDSHLDDLLRVACSNYKPDISKIVKKLSQFQNSKCEFYI